MVDTEPKRTQLDTECGVKLATRLTATKRPSLVSLSPEIIPSYGPKPGEVVEISGESGTGKTIHLMELIAQTIIPKQYGGKGASAIIIDTNSNFHVPLLLPRIIEKHVLHHHTLACPSTNTEDLQADMPNVTHIVYEALKKISLIKCYSGEEYDLTIHHCRDKLTINKMVSLLAIDSITTFYWSDLSLEKPIRMETYLRRRVQELRHLFSDSKIVTIYTRPTEFGDNILKADGLVDYKIFLKFTKSPTEQREAHNYFSNQQSSRRFAINNFGIEWISSRSN